MTQKSLAKLVGGAAVAALLTVSGVAFAQTYDRGAAGPGSAGTVVPSGPAVIPTPPTSGAAGATANGNEYPNEYLNGNEYPNEYLNGNEYPNEYLNGNEYPNEYPNGNGYPPTNASTTPGVPSTGSSAAPTTPGIPSTGGADPVVALTLAASGLVAVAGAAYLARQKFARQQ